MTAPAVLEESARARMVRTVLWATFGLNLAVAGGKIVTGLALGSLAIRADGLHSTTDALNNVVLLVGLWLGARPADPEHPYGHRKLELLAALLVGAGLLLVSFDLAQELVARLRGEAALPRIDALAFVVLALTLIVNVGVATWEARVARRTLSPALASDAAHTKSDVIVTLGVMVSSGLTMAGYVWLDAVAGAAVAVVIALAGLRIVRDNAGYLIDRTLVDSDEVVRVACGVPGVRGARGARSRGMPAGIWLDLTVLVDGHVPVAQGHALAHDVERALRAHMPALLGVQIHVEPVKAHTAPAS